MITNNSFDLYLPPVGASVRAALVVRTDDGDGRSLVAAGVRVRRQGSGDSDEGGDQQLMKTHLGNLLGLAYFQEELLTSFILKSVWWWWLDRTTDGSTETSPALYICDESRRFSLLVSARRDAESETHLLLGH